MFTRKMSTKQLPGLLFKVVISALLLSQSMSSTLQSSKLEGAGTEVLTPEFVAPITTPESTKIDLVKRMLYKTRHIKRQNSKKKTPLKTGRTNKAKEEEAQQSLTLDPSIVLKSTNSDGKETDTQAPSIISKNNFINFCASDLAKVAGAVLMDGIQTKKQPACNPISMGMVPGQNNLPSCKFISPKNLDVIKANETLKVTLAIRNLIVGVFTNPQKTFMNAPAQLDPDTGSVLGHTHIVIQAIDSLSSTTVPDPMAFFFFKGIDDAAKDGVVSVEVKDGLPPGFWRISSINTASNHQPIGATLAQHSIFDDVIYITTVE